MSTRVEWSTIDADVTLAAPGEVEDNGGNTNDGPALAIFTGSNGAVCEAPSWDALADWLSALAWKARDRGVRERVAATGESDEPTGDKLYSEDTDPSPLDGRPAPDFAPEREPYHEDEGFFDHGDGR